jgi:hypothetical protein
MNNVPDYVYKKNTLLIGKGVNNIKIIENFITSEECSILYNECKNELFKYKDSNTGKQWKDKVSGRDALSNDSKKILSNVENNAITLAQKEYQVELELASNVTLVKWIKDDDMGQHVDDFAVFHNNISSILYINDNYIGGEIVFDQYNYSIKPKSGTLIMFPGNKYYAHKVNKVIDGNRYTAPFWFKYKDSSFHGIGKPLNFDNIEDWITKDWEHE